MNFENRQNRISDEALYAIWLSGKKSISVRLRGLLTEKEISPAELFAMGRAELISRLKPSEKELSSLLDKDLTEAREIAERCSEQSIFVISYAHELYPEKLRCTPDFPLVLFIKGQLPAFDDIAVIGVVGTRRATMPGLKLSEDFGREFAGAGCAVCTGLAEGVDSEAAWGAIRAGGKVIGVLGTAIDKIFPAHNRELFSRVLSSGGCLISETGPGLTGGKFMFPKRNRIIAGLSEAVVVTEAPKKSGALITAERAAEYGRDVFAVPAAPGNEAGEGCNALIKDGAGLAVDARDVLSVVSEMYPERIAFGNGIISSGHHREKSGFGRNNPPKFSDEEGNKAVPSEKEELFSPEQKLRSVLEALSENALKVLTAIERPSMLLDEIIEGCPLPPGEITKELTVLQLKGIVRQEPGKRFSVNL